MPYILRNEAGEIAGLFSAAQFNGAELDEYLPDDNSEVVAFRRRLAGDEAPE